MEMSQSWEANIWSATQDNTKFFVNWKVYYHVYFNLLLVPVLSSNAGHIKTLLPTVPLLLHVDSLRGNLFVSHRNLVKGLQTTLLPP
jgi:hypothetical protein